MTVKKTQKNLSTILENTEQALGGFGDALDNNVRESSEANNGLPKGWVFTTIDTYIDSMIGGASPKVSDYDNCGILALNKGDIKQHGIVKIKAVSKRVPSQYADKHSGKVVDSGAVLVTLRDLSQKADFLGLIGRFKSDESALITQGMYSLNIPAQVSSDLLIHYSNSPLYRETVKDVKVGVTQVHLRNAQFLGIEIPLPPRAEQTVIAQTLDALLAQVDSIKTRLDAIPKILKTFRQSVLAAAVSGKLTEEWRGENECEVDTSIYCESEKIKISLFEQAKSTLPELPKSWEIVAFARLITYLTSGSRGWSKYYSDTGALFMRMSNVRYDTTELDMKDLQYVDLPETVEGKRSLVAVGDLLISITADVGRVGHVSHSIGEAYVNQHLALVRPINDVNSEYVATCIASQNIGMKQVGELKRGATKAGLGLDDIRNLAIPLPPIEEQTEIVNRVEELFAFADQVEQQVKNAQGRVNNLTQAILAKAFRGELTDDWRAENPDLISGDNSAEALLAKIKEERDKLIIKKKPRTTKNKVAN